MRFLQLFLYSLTVLLMAFSCGDEDQTGCDNEPYYHTFQFEFLPGNCGSMERCSNFPLLMSYGDETKRFYDPLPELGYKYPCPGCTPEPVIYVHTYTFQGKRGSTGVTASWDCYDSDGNLTRSCRAPKIYIAPQVPCEASQTNPVHIIPMVCTCY